MNKKDLLARVAKQNGMHARALGLASSDITEASATARADILQKRSARMTKVVKLALPVLAVAALATVYVYGPVTPATETTFYTKHFMPALRGFYAWFIMVLTSGLILGGAKLSWDEWFANPDERRFLEAVKGTPKELEVASLLENGGPSVTAWRDLAVSEHGQLYGFDYEVMRSLFGIWSAEQREQRKQFELAEAAKSLEQAVTPEVAAAPSPSIALAA